MYQQRCQVNGLDVEGPRRCRHTSQWAVAARMRNFTPFHDRFGAKLLTHTDQLAEVGAAQGGIGCERTDSPEAGQGAVKTGTAQIEDLRARGTDQQG